MTANKLVLLFCIGCLLLSATRILVSYIQYRSDIARTAEYHHQTEVMIDYLRDALQQKQQEDMDDAKKQNFPIYSPRKKINI